jgi:dynein heavy chain, axonemal
MDYIDGLPLNPEPEVFGMHENASITCAIAEVDMTFIIILSLQPRVGGGGGISREDLIGDLAKDMEQRSVMSPQRFRLFLRIGSLVED